MGKKKGTSLAGRVFGRGRDDDRPKSSYSDEIVDEALDVGVPRWAIREGGDYRKGGDGKRYWLKLPLLTEFERQDQIIKDDGEFWGWFDDFIKEHNLFGITDYRSTTSGGSVGKVWDDWKSGSSWTYEPKVKKVSDWWSDWGWKGNSGATTKEGDMAIALKVVASTVSVVNDTGVRYKVVLESVNGTSATSFEGKVVAVNPEALMDDKLDQARGIEITTGFALHEASHIKYTAKVYNSLKTPTILKPISLAGIIGNVLEDARIEDLTAHEFPGFADFFTHALDYLWDRDKEHLDLENWKADLAHRITTFVLAMRWLERTKPLTEDAELLDELAWWATLSSEYQADKMTFREAVERGLEHLREDEETAKAMAELEAEEEAREAAMKGLQELLDELQKAGKLGKFMMGSPDKPSEVLSDESAKAVADLVDREFTRSEDDRITPYAHYGTEGVKPVMEVLRPTGAGRKPTLGPLVERLRSAFFFRKKALEEPDRLLRSGAVDDEQLWRAGVGDFRVFEQHVVPSDTKAEVTLLVDASGSMSGGNARKAVELASVMLACLQTQRGVTVRVRAHTTDGFVADEKLRILRIWEPGDSINRLSLIHEIPMKDNLDGFAIDWACLELDDVAGHDTQKLLIVLADGEPAGSVKGDHYGGASAMNHIKTVTKKWERLGVMTVQIALARALSFEEQKRMFDHVIPYEGDEKLPAQLTALLSKVFGGIE